MSIAFSLLLLLCFTFRTCDARSFGVPHNKTAKQIHHSISKENDKLNPGRVTIQPERKASTLITATRNNAKEESGRFEKAYEKVNREPIHEAKTRVDEAKGDRVKVQGSRKSESVASVSWRVPHKKRREPEQGFNMDYLPPKTHPPVHN